ncbi:O-antigen ligase family protein [Rosistilla carotiformis]|nr:O-antigen ligase family protein [Rosistilla carotiformis]
MLGIAANAGAIAVWSIMQRATDSTQVVPGIQEEYFRDTFSTFHYRNAGAAYLLVGLSAASGIAIWNLANKQLWNFGRQRGSRNLQVYNRGGYWTDLPVVASISLMLLIGIAIVLSLSRGAWVCGAAGLFFIAIAGLRTVGWRAIAALGACAVAVVAGGSYLAAQHERIETRSTDLALDHIAGDGRFEHFWDGVDAAIHYIPTGSGIGTYGFAHLPFMHEDSTAWYENAHNQYLEVLTESGILGMVLLMSGIVLLGIRSWHVLTCSKEPSQIGIGAAGCVALIAVAGQALVDFVIIYPANMMTAGLLLGAVCGCELRSSKGSPTDASTYHSKPPTSPRPIALGPFAWLMLLAIPLFSSQFILGREVHSQQILLATTPLSDDQLPSQKECSENAQQLQKLTDAMPDNAIAWQQLAWWQNAELRLRIIARHASNQPSVSDAQQSEQWIIQSPMGWFEAFAVADQQQQSKLRNQLVPEEGDRQLLHSSLAALSRANESNPLMPQTHLNRATLAPWIGDDWRPHALRLKQLARSNPEQLYFAGLLFYLGDEQELAIETWRRYLAIAATRRQTILGLAMMKWKAETIVNQLFPANPDLLIAMTGHALRDKKLAELVPFCQRRSEQLIHSEGLLTTAERHACNAQLAELNADLQRAAEHWQNATLAAPQNIDYRLRSASLALKLGDARTAQKQANVARALGGSNPQLDRIFAAIELQKPRHRARDQEASPRDMR